MFVFSPLSRFLTLSVLPLSESSRSANIVNATLSHTRTQTDKMRIIAYKYAYKYAYIHTRTLYWVSLNFTTLGARSAFVLRSLSCAIVIASKIVTTRHRRCPAGNGYAVQIALADSENGNNYVTATDLLGNLLLIDLFLLFSTYKSDKAIPLMFCIIFFSFNFYCFLLFFSRIWLHASSSSILHI